MPKLFDKWSAKDIKIEDPGLVKYIETEPKIAPKTGATYVGNRFHKSRTFIVERLINRLMSSGHKGKKHFISSGHNTGKKRRAILIVKKAFEIIHNKTNENPLKVFVKALENAAPREEIITIEYGGARYPKAVEVAPIRRVDLTLRYMTQGAYQKSFKSKKTIEDTLAVEIINAYNQDPKSSAISKKRNLERQAASAK